MTTLTARQLNRATLARQLLLRREKLAVVDAVHRITAIQGQEPASPYIALWNRVAGFDPADLDRAFADRSIVKSSLMRMTLHAVDAADYPAFHTAMTRSLRAARLGDRRFTDSGLTAADADAVTRHVLAFASEPRTNAEFDAFLEKRFGPLPGNGPWWALRTFAPLHHAPTGGPWSFGLKPSYVAAAEPHERPPVEDATRTLVRRYLEAFGPATIADIAQFSVRYREPIRTAIEAMTDELVVFDGPGRAPLYDIPGGLLPGEDAPAPPRLLPMWDSVLMAYDDRSRIIPPEYRRRFIHQNGDVIPSLLVDGYVAGVWRPVEGGIEASAFHPLSSETWRGLETEAHDLIAFLAGRDPRVYRRYGHWWDTLASAEVRVIGG
ncbi:MAG: winged helix DNA-binding domain-containing protein [Candidatus Limnocylindrales bacterium]